MFFVSICLQWHGAIALDHCHELPLTTARVRISWMALCRLQKTVYDGKMLTMEVFGTFSPRIVHCTWIMVESLVVKDEQQSWQQFSGQYSWHGAIALDHCQGLPLMTAPVRISWMALYTKDGLRWWNVDHESIIGTVSPRMYIAAHKWC